MLTSKKYILSELLILAIISLIPLVWLSGGYMVLGHDVGFHINSLERIKDDMQMLDTKSNFSQDHSIFVGGLPVHILPGLLELIGFPLLHIEKVVFVFWFLAMMLSMYFLCYTLKPGKEYMWFRVTSSIAYVLNFFILTRFVVFERTAFSMLVAVPITLALITKYLHGRISIFTMTGLLGITFLFFNGGGIPPFVFMFFMIIGLFLLFHIFQSRKNWRNMLKIVLAGVCTLGIFILVNTYWLIPILYQNSQKYESIISEDFSSLANWLNEASKTGSFLNLLKLQGDAAWQQAPGHYSDFLTKSIPGICISTIIPLIVFINLLRKKNSGIEKFFISFFVFIALFFVFLSAGSHEPFGKIYIWMIKHIPMFGIFRTPLYKFPYAIVISYAFLFGVFLQSIVDKAKTLRKKTMIGISGIIGLLFLNYLYFDTGIFKIGDIFTIRVKPPSYLFEIKEYMEKQNQDERVLLLPRIVPEYGGVDVYKWGYWSLQPLTYLVLPQSTVIDSGTKYELKIIRELYDAINSRNMEEFQMLAQQANIHWLLLRHDVAWQWLGGTDNPESIKNILQEQGNFLEEQKTFGEWDLYKIRSESDMVDLVIEEGVQKPSMKVKKDSTTKYQIDFTNATAEFTLILKNNFSPQWRATMIDKSGEKLLSEDDHKRIFEYANSWKIQPEKEKFSILLEYETQNLYTIGRIISLTAFIACLGYVIFTKIHKKE